MQCTIATRALTCFYYARGSPPPAWWSYRSAWWWFTARISPKAWAFIPGGAKSPELLLVSCGNIVIKWAHENIFPTRQGFRFAGRWFRHLSRTNIVAKSSAWTLRWCFHEISISSVSVSARESSKTTCPLCRAILLTRISWSHKGSCEQAPYH